MVNNGHAVLDVVNLTVLGHAQVMPAGGAFRTDHQLGHEQQTFGDFTVYGWGGFYNTANAPVTITGNLTVDFFSKQSMGSGMYTFTGSGKTIDAPITIPSATFTGSYTATGTDLQITTPLVSAGGRFVNNTSAFPAGAARICR